MVHNFTLFHTKTKNKIYHRPIEKLDIDLDRKSNIL